MDEKQESLAGIVEEMRELAADIEAGNAVVGQTVWRNYADRIEAAAKRMEQTYLDQIRDAINQWGHEKYKAEHASVGNAAAMREALEFIKLASDDYETYGNTKAGALDVIYEKACAALAAPPRNCDVGTAEEQCDRFLRFCQSRGCVNCEIGDGNRAKFPSCELVWAQMPYEANEKGEADDSNG